MKNKWKIHKLLQVKEENHLICGIEQQLHHWGGVQHQVLRSLTMNELAYLQRFGRRQSGLCQRIERDWGCGLQESLYGAEQLC